MGVAETLLDPHSLGTLVSAAISDWLRVHPANTPWRFANWDHLGSGVFACSSGLNGCSCLPMPARAAPVHPPEHPRVPLTSWATGLLGTQGQILGGLCGR